MDNGNPPIQFSFLSIKGTIQPFCPSPMRLQVSKPPFPCYTEWGLVNMLARKLLSHQTGGTPDGIGCEERVKREQGSQDREHRDAVCISHSRMYQCTFPLFRLEIDACLSHTSSSITTTPQRARDIPQFRDSCRLEKLWDDQIYWESWREGGTA